MNKWTGSNIRVVLKGEFIQCFNVPLQLVPTKVTITLFPSVIVRTTSSPNSVQTDIILNQRVYCFSAYKFEKAVIAITSLYFPATLLIIKQSSVFCNFIVFISISHEIIRFVWNNIFRQSEVTLTCPLEQVLIFSLLGKLWWNHQDSYQLRSKKKVVSIDVQLEVSIGPLINLFV